MQAISYDDSSIETLLRKTIRSPAGESGEPQALRAGGFLGPGLEQVLVREWGDEKELGVDNAEEEGVHWQMCPFI